MLFFSLLQQLGVARQIKVFSQKFFPTGQTLISKIAKFQKIIESEFLVICTSTHPF